MFLNHDVLKSEQVKHVVESDPMFFQGVWIPFERALDLANQEGTTDLLYPLFVHDIGALLHHPAKQRRITPELPQPEEYEDCGLSTGSTFTDISHGHNQSLPGTRAATPPTRLDPVKANVEASPYQFQTMFDLPLVEDLQFECEPVFRGIHLQSRHPDTEPNFKKTVAEDKSSTESDSIQ